MYRAFERLTEAIPLAEQVRDTRVTILGVYHPDTIYSVDNLGQTYQAAGERQKALAMFQQAVAGLEKLDFQHTEAGSIVGNLCDSLEQNKQFDQADAWRRKWLAAVQRRDGPDSAEAAEALTEQAEDILGRERHESAALILRECAASLEKKQPGRWTIFRVQSLLGVALLGQQKLPKPNRCCFRDTRGSRLARSRFLPPRPASSHRGR
jgi:tetratricopeptide (TPR) repeat protein